MFDIKVNTAITTKQLKNAFKGLTGQQFNRGVRLAINETAKVGKSSINRTIRQIYNEAAFTVSAINQSVTLKKATNGMLVATINISGKKIPLKYFKPKKTDKGVSVVLMKKKRYVIPGAFFPIGMAEGHVFAKGKYGGNQFNFRRKRTRPFPDNDLGISKLTGMSIPQAFIKDTQPAVRLTSEELNKVYPQKLNRILKAMAESSGKLSRV